MVDRERFLTVRHVVSGALKSDAKITVMIPDQGEVELKICVSDTGTRSTESLVLLEAKNPRSVLPQPPTLYRPATDPAEGAVMKIYGYQGKKPGRNAYGLIEYAAYQPDVVIHDGEQRNAQFKITEKADDARGLSGSPVFYKGRLYGIMNVQDSVAKKNDFVYGLCGSVFFRQLEGFGIQLPASPKPPAIHAPLFALPEEYQAKMAKKLEELLTEQYGCRDNGCQKPVFLHGSDGIGKKEFLLSFAKRYQAGYAYHVDFADDFLTTITRGSREIFREGSTIEERLQPLRECSEADILIITGADFVEGYSDKTLYHTDAFKELCRLPLHLIIATRQPVPEDCSGGFLELELEPMSMEELLVWKLDRPNTLCPDAQKALIQQTECNPMLFWCVMDILCKDSSLTANGMLEALRDPCKNNADHYWVMPGGSTKPKLRLRDRLNPKVPHADQQSPLHSDCQDILILIQGEQQQNEGRAACCGAMADPVCGLSSAEFDDWVKKNQKTEAFDKLLHIGMITRSSRGYYTVPIIPRLLLKRENCRLSNENRESFDNHRNWIICQRLNPPVSIEQKRGDLLAKLIDACGDPYDGFRIFFYAHEREINTYLRELTDFKESIEMALFAACESCDPTMKLKEAYGVLEKLCADETDRQTILEAGLYWAYNIAMNGLKEHYELYRDSFTCASLCALFDAQLTLLPEFMQCRVIKIHVCWYFGDFESARKEAERVRHNAEERNSNFYADALMILGKLAELRADELQTGDSRKRCEDYDEACMFYIEADRFRCAASKKNLERMKSNRVRYLNCLGKRGGIDTSTWLSIGKIEWLRDYRSLLLELDWEEGNTEAFIEHGKLLLDLGCACTEDVRINQQNHAPNESFHLTVELFREIRKRCPVEGFNRLFVQQACKLIRLLERQPDSPLGSTDEEANRVQEMASWLKELGYSGAYPRPSVFNENAMKLMVFLNQGDPSYGVRELLQNALDACILRSDIECKRGVLYRGEIEVHLDSEQQTLIIIDNGIGMNEQVVKDYYLNVGQSYHMRERKNAEQSRTEHNTVAPSGQFGIGFLTAWLLGDHVSIFTQHIDDKQSYYVDLDFRGQYNWIVPLGEKREIGTVITIRLREGVWKQLENSTHPWNGWYAFEKPKVRYFVNGKQVSARGGAIPRAKETRSDWLPLESGQFREYLWNPCPQHDGGSRIYCNGVQLSGDQKARTLEDMGLQVVFPDVSLIKSDGNYEVDLAHSHLRTFPAEKELIQEVFRYHIARLLLTEWEEAGAYQKNMTVGFPLQPSISYGNVPFLLTREGFTLNYASFFSAMGIDSYVALCCGAEAEKCLSTAVCSFLANKIPVSIFTADFPRKKPGDRPGRLSALLAQTMLSGSLPLLAPEVVRYSVTDSITTVWMYEQTRMSLMRDWEDKLELKDKLSGGVLRYEWKDSKAGHHEVPTICVECFEKEIFPVAVWIKPSVDDPDFRKYGAEESLFVEVLRELLGPNEAHPDRDMWIPFQKDKRMEKFPEAFKALKPYFTHISSDY